MGGAKLRWFLVFVGCLVVTAYFHKNEKIDGVIWSDQEGYYIYLPAVFVHGGFEGLYCYNGCTTISTDGSEHTFTKYTYGVALMEMPFFLVAHALSPLLEYSQNGRSLPYVWAILIAAIVYMLGGLYILHKLLKELHFSKFISMLVPVGLLLGTNLFFYTFREAGMSHVYSFFLVSVLTYASHRKSSSGGAIWNVLTTLPLALIILIRPTNAIAVLIPILWGTDLRGIAIRIKAFLQDERWIFGLAFWILILAIPQIIYWKSVTGEFIFYSYGSEGFSNWNSPKMLQVLFSHQNGWLVYSPLALLGLAGIGMLAKKQPKHWLMPSVVLLLATYIFGSWWAWWFGGAYGHRCFVDFLPVLAFPAAVAVRHVIQLGKPVRVAVGLAALLAVFVNVRMSDIYHGMWDGPGWTWYSYIDKLKEVFYLF